MRFREVVRLLLALSFLLGALANTYSPSVYETFADASILSLYQDLWNSLVYPSIRLFLIPVVLLVLSVAWLLLKSGTYVKVGLGLALAFTLFLVPFWLQGGAIANVFLALVLLWLLRYDYPSRSSTSSKESGPGRQRIARRACRRNEMR